MVGYKNSRFKRYPPIPELLVNQNAPDFSLPDVDGGIHRLHDLRGSLVRQAD